MKIFFSLILSFLITSDVAAQTERDTVEKKYEVVANFTSICCGTANSDFLKAFIKNYSQKNKATFGTFRLGSCGREGEFKILFSLYKFTRAAKAKFVKEIKAIVEKENKKNITVAKNKGHTNLTFDQTKSESGSCRAVVEKW